MWVLGEMPNNEVTGKVLCCGAIERESGPNYMDTNRNAKTYKINEKSSAVWLLRERQAPSKWVLREMF
jgi:hypothetical protein